MSLEMSLLYPQGYDRKQKVQMKDYAFIHSLQIDDMIILKKDSFRGFGDLKLENFYTTDPDVLRYRLDVVEDLVENDSLYDTFCKAVYCAFKISAFPLYCPQIHIAIRQVISYLYRITFLQKVSQDI